ncbi:hypothetical protein [Aeromicrobium sp. 9AM]|uniref:hypothetical protein n=1 Tax=Aeromicrobium sp. 9AM TaxID=2653126 RepID=UPI00135BD11D|nr:hypothetical protein [Aeromicrobium sp. 9AM]
MCASAALAGCTGSEPAPRPSATTTPTPAPSLGPLGQAGCKPASPFISAELQGTPEEAGTSLYGMVFVRSDGPLPVGESIKVAWRMTGKGDLTVRLIDPDGRRKKLDWGPEAHGGSNYHRPGDEWGTGFTLAKPGCWELRFSRDSSHASVWIDATS